MGKRILEKNQYVPFMFFVAALILLSAWYFGSERGTSIQAKGDLVNVVLAQEVKLPFRWGNMGEELVKEGVIDPEKIDVSEWLNDEGVKNSVMTRENSGIWLNLLWAFGLANQNPILEQGPMVQYEGDASRFASTGGWNVAKGNAMDHYSKHAFVVLNGEQQKLVERVSQNIYRPCCDNPTYFPDCNHGMAMLGLLELMAQSGVSEKEMYKIALEVNSYWFPGTYITIAKYFRTKGIPWDKVDPKEALGPSFSSASGYSRVLSEVDPVPLQGQGCGL